MSNMNKFPEGPWSAEPDRVEFRLDGFACLLRRAPMGAWCGYVAMPPGHPWHEQHYDDVYADVHGGLTYADKCDGEICHTPLEGESDNVWWLGFDCAHFDDLVPGNASSQYFPSFLSSGEGGGMIGGRNSGTYRDLAFVRAETEKLAAAAKARAAE